MEDCNTAVMLVFHLQQLVFLSPADTQLLRPKPSAAYISGFSVDRQRLASSGKTILLLTFRILGASRTSEMTLTVLLLGYASFPALSTENCCQNFPFLRIVDL